MSVRAVAVVVVVSAFAFASAFAFVHCYRHRALSHLLSAHRSREVSAKYHAV